MTEPFTGLKPDSCFTQSASSHNFFCKLRHTGTCILLTNSQPDTECVSLCPSQRKHVFIQITLTFTVINVTHVVEENFLNAM